MEVTKSNFKSSLSDIKEAITKANFLSIDCEFSGLTVDSNINAFDTYSQYYSKLKHNVKQFLVLQFGLGVFRYEEESKTFKQQCYNFYIFPRPVNRNVPDFRFICQASSIEFLAGHNFDFNKVFREGISYLNKPNETKYRNVLEERQNLRTSNAATNNNTQNQIPIPEDDQPFIDEIMTQIDNFLASEEEELMLPTCNAFRRRLIYQTFKEKFGTTLSLETRITEKKERCLFVQKVNSDEKRAEKEKQKCEQEMSELEDAIGFSAIMHHISESGKLLVGHNLCLDILHTVDKFMVPLPDDYDEFKDCVSCLYPRILDTKLMASSNPFKELIANTVLCDLIETFKSYPFETPVIEIDENGEGYTLEDKKEHEAGYDAFITGVSYLTMVNYLANVEDLNIGSACHDIKLLRPYLNKLFVLKLQDCPFINLTGKDPNPPRDHVLHVTFPREWKMSELLQFFSPFGNIYISWLNDNSAYVGLHKRDQAAIALHSLSKSNICTVISFARYQAMLKTNLPVAPSPKPAAKKKQLNLPVNKKRKLDSSAEFLFLLIYGLFNWFLSYIKSVVYFLKLFIRSTSSKRFETITEEETEEDETVEDLEMTSKLTKMFDENSAWD